MADSSIVSPEIPTGNALPLNTHKALPFLNKQYQECSVHHAECSTPDSVELNHYPSRLLDVGHEGSPIILRSTRTFTSQQYACLSHCWGNSRPYTLNSTTEQDLKKGIDAEKLPKTFRDAIHVTRSLDIRYLWIDSLCIIQDSESDWATESSRMGQIYARAAFTIAATASSSSDGGLFFERQPQQLLPCLLDINFGPYLTILKRNGIPPHRMGTYLCDVAKMTANCIENAPLNLRAWVSQERQLSHRIMHFSNKQLFWECHRTRTCETYPNGIPQVALTYSFKDATMLKRWLHEFQQQGGASLNGNQTTPYLESGLNESLYDAWCSFRVHYSDCALSRDSDKLVALSGIAKQIGSATGDELVAGLWKSRIIEELCWFNLHEATPCNNPTEWIAPTWSWATSNSRVWTYTESKIHRDHKCRRFETEFVDLDVRTKLSGELTHASMRIKCRPMLAMVIPNSGPEIPGHFWRFQLVFMDDDIQPSEAKLGGKGVYVTSYVSMDDPNFRGPQQVYIILIQRCFYKRLVEDNDENSTQNTLESGISGDSRGNSGSSDEEDEYDRSILEGLLLQAKDKALATFSRIGYFRVNDLEGLDETFDAHLKTEERVITLI
ncbi:heterokaryon incompatibility protein-domain-containing protein [Bipolaris maydis]|nr:heterokaryon incompatibility protein-domain-containing protein [Bipolaris maydis]KAJ5064508.1 heterokaryon incompatibility protein-domain-containing protein [Bipolaris maydis]KAJ6193476.1 heterokaryon incompatibility protein-domain-containing protein [Bipolaris maydis]KAJ6205116.1 heterokaryon incompatibility protein-domain-containing protein [Bipolaris maydis]KAJ6268058.1 heterokaryon incompatibility protein-domain-containing protein [Bipolaris maydis]